MIVDGDLFRRLCHARDRIAVDLEHALDLRDLARVAGVSRFHFLRMFRQCFAETPHQCLTRLRVERAKAELRAGASVTEACLAAGYSSLGSFSGLFRREVGVAPRDYQRAVRVVAPSPGLAASLFVPFCYVEAFAAGAKIAILEKPLLFRP